jgi:hypothetical protein
MAASTPTIAQLRSALGIGTLYSDTVVDEVCQAAQDIVFSYLWKNEVNNYAHSNIVGSGTLYFNESVRNIFFVGQLVTITGNGSTFNGNNKLITSMTDYSITITTTHTTPEAIHSVQPFGTVAGTTYTNYSTVDAVKNAALMVAIDIWQARQASNAGGISPDFQPSPYRMGNTLTARVRGLLAPYLSPNSLVG